MLLLFVCHFSCQRDANWDSMVEAAAKEGLFSCSLFWFGENLMTERTAAVDLSQEREESHWLTSMIRSSRT